MLTRDEQSIPTSPFKEKIKTKNEVDPLIKTRCGPAEEPVCASGVAAWRTVQRPNQEEAWPAVWGEETSGFLFSLRQPGRAGGDAWWRSEEQGGATSALTHGGGRKVRGGAQENRGGKIWAAITVQNKPGKVSPGFIHTGSLCGSLECVLVVPHKGGRRTGKKKWLRETSSRWGLLGKGTEVWSARVGLVCFNL